MLTITPLASEKVKEVLTQQGKADRALRIFVRGVTCSGPAYGMALDQETRPDDLVEELEGIRLVMDPSSVEYLEGAQIDYVDGLTGRGFTIQNPSRQGQGGGCGGGCSCGNSH